MKIMRLLFLICYGVCSFLIAVTPFLSNEIVNNIPSLVLKELFSVMLSNKLLAVACFSGYMIIFTLFPKWIFPHKEKKKVIKQLLRQINSELLEQDLEQHRITLYKKTNYFVAFVLNYWNCLYHVFQKNRWRAKLYLRIPQAGEYLIISKRCGLRYNKSSTMFRIEKNDKELCNGVASYIACNEASALVADLPNVNDIDFKNLQRLRDVKRSRRREVAEYMIRGCVRDFNTLRLMHQKARHLYGTIITKSDGTLWGVLLADSISDKNPFTVQIKKRFNSFATTLSSLINMEV